MASTSEDLRNDIREIEAIRLTRDLTEDETDRLTALYESLDECEE